MSSYPHLAIEAAIEAIQDRASELSRLVRASEDGGYGETMTTSEREELIDATAQLMRIINITSEEY